MSFQNVPMIGKILSVLAVLGVVAGAGVLMMGGMMGGISGSYDALVNGPGVAARALAQADREVVWIERSILQNIWSTSDENNATYAQETVAGTTRFRDALGRARNAVPDRAGALDDLRGRFDRVIETTCARAIAMANASTTLEGNAKAMAELNAHCGPELAAFGREITAYAGDLGTAMGRSSETMLGQTHDTVSRGYAITFGGLVLVLVGAAVVTRKVVVAPIQAIVGAMGRMAQGDLSASISGLSRKDEVGAIALTLETFRASLCEGEAMRRAQAQVLASEAERLASRNAVAERFAGRMTEIAEGFVRSSGRVSGAAATLSATAEQTSRQSHAVSQAATSAATNVQTVAAATEEMAASVREIAVQVDRSLRVATDAVGEVGRVRDDVLGLSGATQTIGGVVDLISDLADRTNLLALNATIEAARAGEAGRGFAVVAAEVKELANQTAKATADITDKIVQIRDAAERAVSSVDAIAGTIAAMREISGSIAGAVEEQGAATQEIAANTQGAASGAGAVTGNIHGVERAAETTSTASADLMTLSGDLAGNAAELRREVEGFVSQLRAA